jgi:hypothetical protein
MNPNQLPPPAAEKFRNLSLAAADAEALAQTTLAAIDSAQSRMGDAQNLADSASDDVRAGKARENVESLQRQIELLREVFTRRQAEHAMAAQVVAQCEFWLGKLTPETRLDLVEPGPPPALRDGETVAQAIDRIRNEIQEVEREIHTARLAPLPKQELRELAATWVAQRVARGRPRLRFTEKEGLVIQCGHPQAWSAGSTEELIDTLAWYNPDHFANRLFQEIDRQLKAADGDALSGEERQRKITQLTARRYRLEADEESLVEQAAMQGFAIARRMNASPSVVLGVKVAARQNEVVAE